MRNRLALQQLVDNGDLLITRSLAAPRGSYEAYWYAWDEAQEQAELAYQAWREAPGRDACAVYVAAQDRADAAQDALAGFAGSLARRPRTSGR